jgi:hypothetical protein
MENCKIIKISHKKIKNKIIRKPKIKKETYQLMN